MGPGHDLPMESRPMPECSPGESARGGRGESGRKWLVERVGGHLAESGRGGSVVGTVGHLTHIFRRFLGVALKCQIGWRATGALHGSFSAAKRSSPQGFALKIDEKYALDAIR